MPPTVIHGAFEWDADKAQANFAKHRVTFEAAALIFGGPIKEWNDARRDYGEERLIAVGAIEGVPLVVVFTWRGARRRLISAHLAGSPGRTRGARLPEGTR